MGRGDDGAHRLLLQAAGQKRFAQQGGGALAWIVRPAGGLPSLVGAHHPGKGPSKEDDRHHGGDRGDDRQGRGEGGTHESTLLGARGCSRGRRLSQPVGWVIYITLMGPGMGNFSPLGQRFLI